MIPWFHYAIIYIGPIPIRVWGLMVSLGILLGVVIVWQRAKRLSLPAEKILDQGIGMIISAFIFARVFHVLFYEPSFYLANPLELFKVWHGGLSSFGGLFGGTLAFFVYQWRYKISFRQWLKTADLLAFALPFGWMIGRIGCFLTHMHPGRLCNCTGAVDFPGGPRLDMGLLEIFALAILALIFFIVRKKTKPDGWFLGVYSLYYGLWRFSADFFRATDIPSADARYFGLTPAQYFAILLVAVGSFTLLSFRPRPRRGRNLFL